MGRRAAGSPGASRASSCRASVAALVVRGGGNKVPDAVPLPGAPNRSGFGHICTKLARSQLGSPWLYWTWVEGWVLQLHVQQMPGESTTHQVALMGEKGSHGPFRGGVGVGTTSLAWKGLGRASAARSKEPWQVCVAGTGAALGSPRPVQGLQQRGHADPKLWGFALALPQPPPPPRGWTVAWCHPMALEQCYKWWWHTAGAWMGCREKSQHAFPSTSAAHALKAPNIVAAESFGELPLHRAPTYLQLELELC